MTNKTTKRALLASIVSLVLCFSMLLGTTYAWFTDSAATAVNTIQSGNLDIEVLYATPADVVNGAVPEGNWKVVNEQTPVFNPAALWEPGYTEIVYFKFVNKGSLSLQFQMHVDILKETAGINVDGNLFALSDYIEAYVCGATASQFQLYETRNIALNPPLAPAVWHGSLKQVANLEVATPSDPSTWLSLDTWNWLEPAEEYYCTMVLFMPTTVGNEANYKLGETAPKIDLGINFIATQYSWENEKDSYGKDYDEKAEYPEIPQPAIPNPSTDVTLGDTYNDGEYVTFTNQAINGTVTADKVFARVDFVNVTGNLKVDLSAENTIVLEDCTLDSLTVTNMPNNYTNQICIHNVTVNGVKITRDNIGNYFVGYDSANFVFY